MKRRRRNARQLDDEMLEEDPIDDDQRERVTAAAIQSGVAVTGSAGEYAVFVSTLPAQPKNRARLYHSLCQLIADCLETFGLPLNEIRTHRLDSQSIAEGHTLMIQLRYGQLELVRGNQFLSVSPRHGYLAVGSPAVFRQVGRVIGAAVELGFNERVGSPDVAQPFVYQQRVQRQLLESDGPFAAVLPDLAWVVTVRRLSPVERSLDGTRNPLVQRFKHLVVVAPDCRSRRFDRFLQRRSS